MKVLGSRVLVQVKKSCTQKIGEIEVPVGAGEFEVAEVIEVGPEIEKDHLKPGDTVYIYQNSGKKFTHEGTEYRTVSTNEIIVVL